jgi:hypothetical protein
MDDVSTGPGGFARGLIDKLEAGEGQMLRAAAASPAIREQRHAAASRC